jgi:hypothetical protein
MSAIRSSARGVTPLLKSRGLTTAARRVYPAAAHSRTPSTRLGQFPGRLQQCVTPTAARCYTSSPSSESVSKTGLYDLHVSNGAKMVPFGGYMMPVQYSDLGVGESHKWTREKASLFDVSHM